MRRMREHAFKGTFLTWEIQQENSWASRGSVIFRQLKLLKYGSAPLAIVMSLGEAERVPDGSMSMTSRRSQAGKTLAVVLSVENVK